MPMAAPKICTAAGCSNLVESGRCEACSKKHNKDRNQRIDANRPNAYRRGYTHKWSKASKAYLAQHALCVICRKQGMYTPAVLVDHIIPHKGDGTLFNDMDNWQALCKTCHDIKTATEDGGFGR